MGHQTQLIETNHEVGAVKHADFSNFDKDSTTWFLLVPFSICFTHMSNTISNLAANTGNLD